MEQPPILKPETIDVHAVPRSKPHADVSALGAPIHALSALVMVAVDNLWNLADWTVIGWVVTIPLSFLTVFVPVFLLQKVLKKDTNARAFAFALLLGVLAAIPTSITGTPVGLGLLAWTGLSRLVGRGK